MYSNILVRSLQEEKRGNYLKIFLSRDWIGYSKQMMKRLDLMKKLPTFEISAGEKVLYETIERRPWYVTAWKIAGDSITVVMLTVISWFLFSEWLTELLQNILSLTSASILTKFICLGLVPLLVTAWATEDVARTFTGKFVLTDQRLWVRGSPYAWNVTETPLHDIDSLTFRRDALFIRLKSSRKLLVHMLPDGKLVAKVYKDSLGKTK